MLLASCFCVRLDIMSYSQDLGTLMVPSTDSQDVGLGGRVDRSFAFAHCVRDRLYWCCGRTTLFGGSCSCCARFCVRRIDGWNDAASSSSKKNDESFDASHSTKHTREDFKTRFKSFEP